MRLSNSFILSLSGIIALLTLGLAKGIDVSMSLSGVVLSYVGSRAGQKGAMVFASSRDANSNTDEIIRSIMN